MSETPTSPSLAPRPMTLRPLDGAVMLSRSTIASPRSLRGDPRGGALGGDVPALGWLSAEGCLGISGIDLPEPAAADLHRQRAIGAEAHLARHPGGLRGQRLGGLQTAFGEHQFGAVLPLADDGKAFAFSSSR